MIDHACRTCLALYYTWQVRRHFGLSWDDSLRYIDRIFEPYRSRHNTIRDIMKILQTEIRLRRLQKYAKYN